MMDSRLTFLHHLGLSAEDPRKEREPPIESGGRWRRKPLADVETTVEADSPHLCWREKPLRVRQGARTVNRHRWVR